MNLTIDPNVFMAAQEHHNDDCWVQLRDLSENKPLFTLSLDEDGTLYENYRGFITEHIRYKNAVVQLCDKLLASGVKLSIKPCDPPTCTGPTLSSHCNDSLDKLMIGMASQQAKTLSNPGLTLLLSGPPNSPPRCLHQETVKTCVEDHISGLEVRYASDRKSIKKWLKSITSIDQHVHSFELQVEGVIGRKYGCHTRQPRNQDGKVNGEQFDVYCFQEVSESIRLICVGECKLLFDENQDTMICAGDIKQLQKKIKLAEGFEKNREGFSNEFEIRSFIVSNRPDMEVSAWKLAKQLGIVFLKAIMPTGWQDNPKWELADDKLIEIPHPEFGTVGSDNPYPPR